MKTVNLAVLLALIVATAVGAARMIGAQTLANLKQVFTSVTYQPNAGTVDGNPRGAR